MEKSQINKKLSSKKLKLSLLLGPIDNIKIGDNQSIKENKYFVDPITRLLTKFEEIKEILNIKDQIIFK